MRYLSQQDNHISGKGESTNDQFMRVNAFLGNADLSMILHMLSQRSDTDLLSAPKVVTKSGQEATIKVVTIYRYPQDYDVTIQSTSSSSSSSITGGGSGSDGKILPMVEPQNFETQEVGVILTCTPDVSADNQTINIQLTPKVIGEPTWRDYGMKVPMSSVMSSTAQAMALASGNEDMQWFTVPMEQPFFKERSIDTKVTLYNGATIVMGGLITEERKSMEDKIPFLGDIPFVGRLFRSRSEWSNKRNLLIFVTARLVDPRGRQISLTEDSATSEQAEAGVTPAPNK
jgi:general secretion pathway protein D